MIVEFSVENFLSIREKQTLSFEPTVHNKLDQYYITQIEDKVKGKKPLSLLKIAIMYGANASGKTNFLKALTCFKFLVIKSKSNKNEKLPIRPFIFDRDKSTKMEMIFIANQTKYCYQFEFNVNCIIREELSEYKYLTSERKETIYLRTTDTDKQIQTINFNDKLNIDETTIVDLKRKTLWNESVIVGFSKISADISQLKDISDWFEIHFPCSITPEMDLINFASESINNGSVDKNSVVEFLKNADFNISDIIVDNSLYTIFQHVVDDKSFSLSINEESLGTKRFYGLSVVLLNQSKESLFICIDELDSSLHPDLYNAFILTFLQNASNSQLFITTHNRDFLRNKDILRKDALWIANKNDDASTEIYSFADFDSSVFRNDTSSFYNVYSIGKLGGTPNVINDLMLF
ncbi:MAG: ATP-binding protein [Bacteroidales bacterium]|nr:ATP-binding protein [Bacteroidales bacterium]